MTFSAAVSLSKLCARFFYVSIRLGMCCCSGNRMKNEHWYQDSNKRFLSWMAMSELWLNLRRKKRKEFWLLGGKKGSEVWVPVNCECVGKWIWTLNRSKCVDSGIATAWRKEREHSAKLKPNTIVTTEMHEITPTQTAGFSVFLFGN